MVVWFGLIFLGGQWMVRAAFKLRDNEEGVVGFAVGLAIQIWLANLLEQFLPPDAAFWAAPVLVLLIGLGMNAAQLRTPRELFRIRIVIWHWLAVGLLAYVFTIIGFGLAIFDDYQNLPMVSQLAAGENPPRFVLDPDVNFGYHHFLLLFAAQVMRLADMFPWTALDVSRGLVFGVSVVLTGIWVQRLIRSAIAGVLGGMFGMFSSGTRWLLLLLPPAWVERISGQVTLIGSSAQSVGTLANGLVNPWSIEGTGPILFPWAYLNGIAYPSVMIHNGTGHIGALMTMPILLTHNRWRGWRGWLVTTILLASTALVGEVGVVIGALSWGALTVIYLWQHRRERNLLRTPLRDWLPGSLWGWLLALGVSYVVIMFQGGLFTATLTGMLARLFGTQAGEAYFSLDFALIFPPATVSSHLGVLSIGNFSQLVALLAEMGPFLLVYPLIIVWGIKAYRNRRWYEVSLVLAAVISLLTIFVQYTGNAGISASARLFGGFAGLARTWCFVLFWMWAEKRSAAIKGVLSSLALVAVMGGFVLFGIELIAAQKPVRSTFITDLDARMMDRHWNQLEENVLIFDNVPYRAPTLFARPTDAGITWYENKPEWEALQENFSPQALRAYGFDYAYISDSFMDELTPAQQETLQDACVVVVDEVTAKRTPEYRRLLDIRGCE